jgi:hypothetical protein
MYDRACPTLLLRASTLVTIRGPVDNWHVAAEYVDEHGELVGELPREEALVRLYELAGRFHGPGLDCPVNYATAGGLPAYKPHRFAFGCCRDA